jgi:NADH:ubiquinone oxidoreductase subunit F (NADH-binding)/(2Fe-2S) ferredoxin
MHEVNVSMEILKSVNELESLRTRLIQARSGKHTLVTVCCGSGCLSNGALKVAAALKKDLAQAGMEGSVEVKTTGCHGFCERGPITVIEPEGILYQGVGRKQLDKDVGEIVETLKTGGEPVKRLLYKDIQTKEVIAHFKDIPFYAKQRRVALRNNGIIDPKNIEDYLVRNGYASFAKAVAMKPEEIIALLKDSQLRGRGGAGFPTGQKWELARRSEVFPKYVICNGDEGDPGAFMDRSIMEGDPHSVIEGMLIAAWAIAGGKGPIAGYLYVRAEYPLAVENLTLAVQQARTLGLLGTNILGSGFDFDLTLNRGAGAFVCGEETALIASIEGKPGLPRPRPPFPAQEGLFGKPTNINNVETLACIPPIIENGAEWFRSIGVDKNGGTKVFSLVGKVNYTGLVEVPMGTTIREVVFGIGGGIQGGKQFKAVQTGGPSGGCIPESLLDLPLTYEGLMQAGSIMGSGGMIVVDNETCMVDVARYFLKFVCEESCGKCIPCREGTKRMSDILERICAGDGQEGDIETLERMGKAIAASSLCGLGQTAPNPTLSTIRYFRDEYEAHIRDKRCPAGVCKALISYRINEAACTGCGACARNCPVNAITGEKKKPHVLDQDKCVKCGACRESCKFNAVVIEKARERVEV